MQVSVEKTSELSRKMTVSVPETVVQEKIAAKLKSLAREVKIDGFRPGKAPQQVINKMYGERVRGEIASDLIQSTYFEALQTENLKPAGYPHIDSLEETDGFKYTAVFEVYPEISLQDLNQLQVNRPVATVAESDVDAMIAKLKEQKKGWEVVERAAQSLDRITINFSGKSEDENFTNGDVEKYPVEIGAKQMIPGFEDNLIGLSAGDSKTFTVSFPEDYGNAKLAGKEATFDVVAVSVEAPTLPEIDAEFITSYGIAEGTMEAFREDVKANMERELARTLRNKFKVAVMDALYEKVQINVPNTLVDQEVETMMKPYIENAKRQKINLDDLQLPRDAFQDQAKRRVALGLILGEVIETANIVLDADKVRTTIEDMAKSYERPEDVVSWYYADKTRLNDVQQMVLEEQTVDWLVAQASVADELTTFDAIMDQK